MQRFPLPPDAVVRPFAITGAAGAALLASTGVRVVDPTEPADTDFCLAMNRGNCLAYDGTPAVGGAAGALGMPLWVLLDCCALPSAVFGFEVERRFVPPTLADALDPAGALPWVGVTEYVALPSVAPGEVVGVSLFSFAAGGRWGQRTKSMTLRLLGATRQTGVTQYSSPGIALHLAFGPLRIVSPIAAVHSRPLETFVYAIDVPDAAALAALERGEQVAFPAPDGERVRFDTSAPDVGPRVRALAATGAVWLVDAGPVAHGRVPWVDVVVQRG